MPRKKTSQVSTPPKPTTPTSPRSPTPPASPNANQVKCGKCFQICKSDYEDINEDSINCDVCGIWLHQPCSNVSPEEWKIIKGKNESITFTCEKCVSLKGQNFALIRELKSDLTKVIERNNASHQQLIQANNEILLKSIEAMKIEMLNTMDTKIEQKINEFAAKNEKIIEDKIQAKLPSSSELANETIKIEEKIKHQVTESFDELADRESRKNNIILFNLKESLKTNEEEALTEDLNHIKEIIKITNPNIHETLAKKLNENNIYRMGSKPEVADNENPAKQRPVKLTLPDEKTKFQVIKNSFKLKSCSTYPKIGLRMDLTKKQQIEDKQLRQEVERRKANGEDVMIFRNRVIKREDHQKLKDEASANSKATPSSNGNQDENKQ